ncbi:MAG: type II secretion system protein [Phycisphaerales bacterium]|nr:type II secretion system protein [Phycisphaerales bacterium]
MKNIPGPSSNYCAGQLAPFRAGGFTLIELLAVIGVLSILLALFLPAIGRSKTTAQLTAHAQQIRQHAALLTMYTTVSDGYYPIADPTSSEYCMIVWYQPLIKAGLAGSFRDFQFVGQSGRDLPTSYLSANFVVEQAIFDASATQPPTEDEWPVARIRATQVRQPSDKGILFSLVVLPASNSPHWCCLPEAPPGPVAYADGSAVVARWTDLLPGGLLRVRNWVGYAVYSTWNGVRGSDRASGSPPFSMP